MRKTTYMMTLAAILTILTSCEDKTNETSLSVNPQNLEFGQEGGTQILQVNSDGGWTVNEMPTWITLSAVTGSGEEEINVTAQVNNTGVLREGIILIRTGDASSAATVNVRQTSGGLSLTVNDMQERVLNGTAMSSDSILVNSNISWTVEAPSWLSLAWEKRAIRNDGRTTCSGSGTLIIIADQNNELDDRYGVVKLISKEDDTTVSIPVSQMGYLNARPVGFATLANSFSFQWRFGCFVTHIFWQAFEGGASAEEKTFEKALKYVGFLDASTSVLSSRRNCKPNTMYEICAFACNEDHSGYNDNVNGTQLPIYSHKVTTPSDYNAALVSINDVRYDQDNTKWYYRYTKNPYVHQFYTTRSFDAKYEAYSDSHIAWLMQKALQTNPSAYPLRSQDGLYSVTNQGDYIHIIAWAVGADGKLSSMISRTSGMRQAEGKQRNDTPEWDVVHRKAGNDIIHSYDNIDISNN